MNGLPYAWRLDPEDYPDLPDGKWLVVTADGEEELTGPVTKETAKIVVEAFRRARAYEDRQHLTAAN